MKKGLLLLVLFTGLYFTGRIFLVWERPNSDSESRVSVKIERGMTLSEISDLLEEKELIR